MDAFRAAQGLMHVPHMQTTATDFVLKHSGKLTSLPAQTTVPLLREMSLATVPGSMKERQFANLWTSEQHRLVSERGPELAENHAAYVATVAAWGSALRKAAEGMTPSRLPGRPTITPRRPGQA